MKNFTIPPTRSVGKQLKLNHSLLLISLVFIGKHLFTFRVLNCCSWAAGFSLSLTVKLWILCLTLNSTWQVPPREQNTIQGLYILSFRPQGAVFSWPKCPSTLTDPLQEELSVHISPWKGCQRAILHNQHKRTQGTSRSQSFSKWSPFQVQWERKWVSLRKFLPGLPFTEQPKPREKGLGTSFVHYFHNLINISALKKFMEQLYYSKCAHKLTLAGVVVFVCF